MKKLLFFAAVASVMLTACSSGNEEAKVDDSSPLRLSTQNITGLTRAGQSVQLTAFDNNESVSIFLVESVSGTATLSGTNITSYTQPLNYTTGASGALNPPSPQYWPQDGNNLFVYGVYPASAVTTSTAFDATGVSFSVAADQSTITGYKASDLMTGAPATNPVVRTVPTPTIALTFTHLLTKIDVNLTAGAGFTDVSSAVVTILNTKPSTTFNVQNTTVGAASGTATAITAGTGTATSAIIVPQTVTNGNNLIQVAIGGGNYYYKLTADVTFAAQTKYTYNLTVNKAGLVLTATTITPWTDTTPVGGTAELQ